MLSCHEQTVYVKDLRCLKSVQIRSSSAPYFPKFGQNTDQKNSVFGQLLPSVTVIKKFGFSTSFINRMEGVLNKPESCVISRGKIRQYFQLHIGACQGSPISAYLFYFSNGSLI